MSRYEQGSFDDPAGGVPGHTRVIVLAGVAAVGGLARGVQCECGHFQLLRPELFDWDRWSLSALLEPHRAWQVAPATVLAAMSCAAWVAFVPEALRRELCKRLRVRAPTPGEVVLSTYTVDADGIPCHGLPDDGTFTAAYDAALQAGIPEELCSRIAGAEAFEWKAPGPMHRRVLRGRHP